MSFAIGASERGLLIQVVFHASSCHGSLCEARLAHDERATVAVRSERHLAIHGLEGEWRSRAIRLFEAHVAVAGADCTRVWHL